MLGKHELLRNALLQLLSLTVLAAVIFAVIGFVSHQRSESLRKGAFAQSGATHLAAGLGALCEAQIVQINGLATDPQLASLLEGNKVISTHTLLTRTVASFPGSISAELVSLSPLGIADDEFDTSRFRTNILVDLISRAFADQRPSPEAYQQDGRWLISLAAPVRPSRTEAIGGVLVVTLDAAGFLKSAFPSEAGELKVLSGGREVFRQGTGTADFVSDRVAVPSMPMSLEYSPAATQIADIGASFIPLLTAVAVVGGALVFGILLSMRRLKAGLNADVRVLMELGTKQRSTTAAAPNLGVSELTPLGDTMLELVKRLGASKDKPRAAARASKPTEEQGGSQANPLEMLLEEAAVDLDEEDDFELELDEELEIPAEIFRAYDIRGTAELLSDAVVLVIARALGSTIFESGQNAVVVGADARESSPRIREALVKGLLESGCDVTDIGTVATPMLYFGAHHMQIPHAVMVTGSHLGADHNGLKILIDHEPISTDAITAIRERAEAGTFCDEQGSYRVADVNSDYVQAVHDDIVISDNPKVVVDCGNGAAAVIATELFEGLGVRVIPLFDDLNGKFPNRAPDPSNPENLRGLIAAVKEHQADLGIAFDGDADRLGVVDDKGRIVQADRLMMLFSRDVLSRQPGADIVFDVKCSRHLARVISEAGGRPIMWRSGHAMIKARMNEAGALLGGEYTGHICFQERWFGFDDALYSAARLLEIIGLEGRSLSELLSDLPSTVSTPEIYLPVDEAQKSALMDKISDSMRFDDAKTITLDGLRVEFTDGWGLVRCSNTEAALTLRFEAEDPEALARIRGDFRAQIAAILDDDSISF